MFIDSANLYDLGVQAVSAMRNRPLIAYTQQLEGHKRRYAATESRRRGPHRRNLVRQ